ncbi:hypothetical protein ES703_79417 [subsurface metagenome]
MVFFLFTAGFLPLGAKSIRFLLRIPLEERKVELEELLRANEAFFTNSLMEIMPLTRVNSHHIGEARPGRVTEKIGQEYKKQTGAAAIIRECKSS